MQIFWIIAGIPYSESPTLPYVQLIVVDGHLEAVLWRLPDFALNTATFALDKGGITVGSQKRISIRFPSFLESFPFFHDSFTSTLAYLRTPVSLHFLFSLWKPPPTDASHFIRTIGIILFLKWILCSGHIIASTWRFKKAIPMITSTPAAQLWLTWPYIWYLRILRWVRRFPRVTMSAHLHHSVSSSLLINLVFPPWR